MLTSTNKLFYKNSLFGGLIYGHAYNLKNNFLKIYDGKRPYYGGAQKWFNCDDLKRLDAV